MCSHIRHAKLFQIIIIIIIITIIITSVILNLSTTDRKMLIFKRLLPILVSQFGLSRNRDHLKTGKWIFCCPVGWKKSPNHRSLSLCSAVWCRRSVSQLFSRIIVPRALSSYRFRIIIFLWNKHAAIGATLR